MSRFVLSLCVPYIAVALMITLLQRKLIYLPHRESVAAVEAGYPDGRLREVQLATTDGLTLHGWLILADDAPAGADDLPAALDGDHPLVLYFPGNGGHRGYRVPEIRQFTGLGCHVLYFDYRGYAENAGSPQEELLAADAQAVWEFATETLDVPAQRILLWGESLGGGVATRLAADLSEAGTPPAGLMMRGTFTSLVDVAAHHYPWLPVRWLLLERFPSVDRIGSVACPILMIHGRRDRIVPLAQGRALFEAAPETSESGVPKRFVELPDAGHNDVMYVAADEVEAAVAEFLAEVFKEVRTH